MTKKIISKAAMEKERDPEKLQRVLKQKGYKDGILPKGKELHHVIPVAEGGKTTKKNTRVISTAKHKLIHKNRAKIGKI